MIHGGNNLDMAYGGHINDNAMYGKVKAWSHQAKRHHLNIWESPFMTPRDMTLPVLNELKSSLEIA